MTDREKDEDDKKSYVQLNEAKSDSTTGMVIHSRSIVLEGLESTKELLKLAKKEMKWK